MSWRASRCASFSVMGSLSLAITGRVVCSPQIGLDSKAPVVIVLWKDAHAVGVLSFKAGLAAMAEGLVLKVIGLANIYAGMRSPAFGVCFPLSDNVHRCNRFESSITGIRSEGVVLTRFAGESNSSEPCHCGPLCAGKG